MTARNLWRTTGLAALAALPLLTSSCEAEDKGPGAKPPAAAATPPPARPQPPAVDACALVTKADAEAALGLTLGEPVRGDVPPLYSCSYATSDRVNSVAVTVTAHTDARQAHDAYVMAVKINSYEEFDGLGDRAYRSPVSDVHVLSRQYEMSVDVSQSIPKEAQVKKAREIAARALDRLPK